MDTQLDWWPSPAKLNLFLHITGRQPNGYHRLQSLFQMLDYGDELAFKPETRGEIVLETPIPGVADADNLIVKAARLLREHTGFIGGCRIWLKKVLPMGGGIGGGSSNAATTLVALNHLWGLGLSRQELADLGLTLGADVPIFVHGETAFAEGVGEVITPADSPAHTFLVLNPNIHVSTAEVFGAPELPRNTPEIAWRDYQFETTHNDCQQLVCDRHPEVANLLQWLLEYAPSRMTGTGACLFAIFDQHEEACKRLAKRPAGCSGFVARGVKYSPLRQKLDGLSRARDNN